MPENIKRSQKHFISFSKYLLLYHLIFNSPHNHDSDLASRLKSSGFRGLAGQRRPALPKLLSTNEVFTIAVVVIVIVFVIATTL